MSENQQDALEPVMRSALRLLSASPKSRRELKDRLLAKGFAENDVEEVLGRLERNGFVNDRALAGMLVERFSGGRPSGNQRIVFELKKRGIPAAVCDEIGASLGREDEGRRARELARTKWERLGRLDPETRAKRVFGFLVRRGFDFESASAAMAALRREADQQ